MRLSRTELRVFASLLRLAAEGSRVAPDLDASRAIFEGTFARAHRETRTGMRALLFALEWMPFLFGCWRFWQPFSRRTRDEQLAYIDRIQHSRYAMRRLVFKGVSAAVQLAHYARPEVQRAVGYDARALNAHYQSAPRDRAG